MKRRKLWKRDLEALRQNVPCALGGIVLALALAFTVNAQAPALDGNPPKSSQQASEKALEQTGCVQDGKFKVADLFAMYDTGIVPSCFGNVPASPAVAARSTTDPAVITALAAGAYVWGLGPEY